MNELRYFSFISNWLFRVCIEYRNTLKRLCQGYNLATLFEAK
nr:MAG TPA: Chromosome region maintenance protein [Caudoviricetes sp.]